MGLEEEEDGLLMHCKCVNTNLQFVNAVSLKQNLQNSHISEFLAPWPRCVASAHPFPRPAEW